LQPAIYFCPHGGKSTPKGCKIASADPAQEALISIARPLGLLARLANVTNLPTIPPGGSQDGYMMT